VNFLAGCNNAHVSQASKTQKITCASCINRYTTSHHGNTITNSVYIVRVHLVALIPHWSPLLLPVPTKKLYFHHDINDSDTQSQGRHYDLPSVQVGFEILHCCYLMVM